MHEPRKPSTRHLYGWRPLPAVGLPEFLAEWFERHVDREPDDTLI